MGVEFLSVEENTDFMWWQGAAYCVKTEVQMTCACVENPQTSPHRAQTVPVNVRKSPGITRVQTVPVDVRKTDRHHHKEYTLYMWTCGRLGTPSGETGEMDD